MLDSRIEQHIALAGVCQAAALVQKVARSGAVDTEACEASLSSILVTDPESPQHVFGQLSNLKMGYKSIVSQLSGRSSHKDAELTRYVASLLSLERKLAAKPDALNEVNVFPMFSDNLPMSISTTARLSPLWPAFIPILLARWPRKFRLRVIMNFLAVRSINNVFVRCCWLVCGLR